MLVLAWLVYFAIWGLSWYLLGKKVSNVVTGLIVGLSILDLVYLAMHDLRALILVILATVFTLIGVSRTMSITFKGGE